MLKKSLFILLVTCLVGQLSVYGQERITTKLNRHFLPISEDDEANHRYNQVEAKSVTGETVTWIFDLQNRMIKQAKVGVHPTENFKQEVQEFFDTTGQLTIRKILNLDNSKYAAFYFYKGEKKAQVIYHGQDVYEIWRNNPDSLYTSDFNDFDPGIDKKAWNSFLVKNLRYPSDARKAGAEGTVIIAILINEEGEIKEAEIANSEFVNPHLATEALRVVSLFKGKFTPAKNINGMTEEVWINIPIRFSLS
jgi:TonB family protein